VRGGFALSWIFWQEKSQLITKKIEKIYFFALEVDQISLERGHEDSPEVRLCCESHGPNGTAL
jgi:hypothetical protein